MCKNEKKSTLIWRQNQTYVNVVGIVSCSKAKSYRSENELRAQFVKSFFHSFSLYFNWFITWLCYTKFKMWMDNFPIDWMFFGWPWFVHFTRILCIQFAQINDNIFHASLFNAMCCGNNKLPWYQHPTTLIFGNANMCLPWQCSKWCCTPTNDPLLNGILGSSWNTTLELVLFFFF